MTTRASTPAFTMVETVIAALIVAVMLTAAVSLSASAGLAQFKNAERATANNLADSMVAEVMARAYADPGGGAGIGLDSGETAGVRTGYDDVDDYNGLTETAPAERDGTAISGLQNWERLVVVSYVTLGAYDTASGSDTGLKRIVIKIKHNNAVILTRQTLRSSAR